MNANTRLVLSLLSLALVLVAWLGGTVGCMVYACQPGNAGAVLLAGLCAVAGYGFWREALNSVAA